MSERKNIITLSTPTKDQLLVDPSGAKINLTLKGTLIFGSFNRGDGKIGMTHPCTPIFGPDGKNIYGLKQHGNMRNEDCEVLEVEDSVIVTHTISDEGYPRGMKVKQIMHIKDGSFSCAVVHTNAGDEKAAVNSGEHCYFDAPQGYEGTTINGRDITSLIENNWDGIAIDLQENNTIQIPGKPEINLTQNGLQKAMVWVGKNPESKEIDKTYICIEPVERDPNSDFFGSEESMIYPGKSRSIMFRLQIS